MTRLSELKRGDVLIADGGFSCLREGEPVAVQEDPSGLFVACKDGQHFLSGQTDDGDTLIGLTKPINRRAAAKARTYQKVKDAAAALFAAEGGYEAATIRTIAKAAGMSTGAVFANFADKAALYSAIHGHEPISPQQGRELARLLLAVLEAGVGTDASSEAAAYLVEHGLLDLSGPETES